MRDDRKADLAHALATPELLHALSTSSGTTPASQAASTTEALAALQTNLALASHLPGVHAQLLHSRAQTSTRLLQAHAQAQQWRLKQAAMDKALAGFSPQALYQRLAQAVVEQEALCLALEESFLNNSVPSDDARSSTPTTTHTHPHTLPIPASSTPAASPYRAGHLKNGGDREVADWVRSFRDARKVYYLRREGKERWDEGRVGGWR